MESIFDQATYSIDEEENVISFNLQTVRFTAVKRLLVSTSSYGLGGGSDGRCARQVSQTFTGEAMFFPKLEVSAKGDKDLSFDIIIAVPRNAIEMDESDDIPLLGMTPFSKELGLAGLGFCDGQGGINSIYHAAVPAFMVVSMFPNTDSDVDEDRLDQSWSPYFRDLDSGLMAIPLRALVTDIANSEEMVSFSYCEESLPMVNVAAVRVPYREGPATFSCGAVEQIKQDFLNKGPAKDGTASSLSKNLARLCGAKHTCVAEFTEVSTWNHMDAKTAKKLADFVNHGLPVTREEFQNSKSKE